MKTPQIAKEKSFIRVHLQSTTQLTSNNELIDVPLNVEDYKKGNGLTLLQNQIQIGKGIHKIKAIAQVQVNVNTAGEYVISFNDVNIKTYNLNVGNSQFLNVEMIFDVSEGDKVAIKIKGPGKFGVGGGVLNTYLEVEEL